MKTFFSEQQEEEADTPFFDNLGGEVKRTIFNEGPPTQQAYDLFNGEGVDKSIISALDQFEKRSEDFSSPIVPQPTRDTPNFALPESNNKDEIMSFGEKPSKEYTFGQASNAREQDFRDLPKVKVKKQPIIAKDKGEESQFSVAFSVFGSTSPLRDSKSKPDKPTQFQKLFAPSLLSKPEEGQSSKEKPTEKIKELHRGKKVQETDTTKRINTFFQQVIEKDSEISLKEETTEKSSKAKQSNESKREKEQSKFTFNMNRSRAESKGSEERVKNGFAFNPVKKSIAQSTEEKSKQQENIHQRLRESKASHSGKRIQPPLFLRRSKAHIPDSQKSEEATIKSSVSSKKSLRSSKSKQRSFGIKLKNDDKNQKKENIVELFKSQAGKSQIEPKDKQDQSLNIKNLAARAEKDRPEKIKIKSIAPTNLFGMKKPSSEGFKPSSMMPFLNKKEMDVTPKPIKKEQPKNSMKNKGSQTISQLLFDDDSEVEDKESNEIKQMPRSIRPSNLEFKISNKPIQGWDLTHKNKEEDEHERQVEKRIEVHKKGRNGETPSEFVRYMMQLMDLQRDYLRIKHRCLRMKDSYRELAIFDKQLNKRVDESIKIGRQCLTRFPL